MSQIRFEGFGFQYLDDSSQRRTLKAIDLSIEAGECILFSGCSGSGKSTLIRAINGLIPNFYRGEVTGRVTLDNSDISMMDEKVLYRKIATVYQNPRSQFFTDTIGSELVFSAENFGFDRDTIETLLSGTLSHFHLTGREHEKLEQLSSGEKQRVACASSCLTRPELILLDEPSANLDVSATSMLAQIISAWKAQGVTVVVADHRSTYLRGLIDREVHLERGEIVAVTPHQMKQTLSLSSLRATASKRLSKSNSHEKKWRICSRKKLWSGQNNHVAIDCLTKGAVVAVIGENGEGKSSLFRQLCGLHKGQFQLSDENGTLTPKALRQQCFYVDQEVNRQLLCDSVLEEVLLNMPYDDDERALEILRELGLEHLKQAHPLALSGGQKQRLALATAISANREFTVLDEPSSGLDQVNVVRVVQQIEKLSESGKTVIVISHDSDLLLNCADVAVHIRNHAVDESYYLDKVGRQKMQSFLRLG